MDKIEQIFTDLYDVHPKPSQDSQAFNSWRKVKDESIAQAHRQIIEAVGEMVEKLKNYSNAKRSISEQIIYNQALDDLKAKLEGK